MPDEKFADEDETMPEPDQPDPVPEVDSPVEVDRLPKDDGDENAVNKGKVS